MADRIECYYGESGTGKSEAVVEVIKQVALETGLRARVCIGDGSKATYIDSGLVDAGVVDIWDYTMWDYPQTTLQLLCEGYWPEDVNVPNSKLLPPNPKVMSTIGVQVIEGLSVGAMYLMGDNVGGLAYRSGRGEKIGQDSPVRVGDGTYDRLGKFTPAMGGLGREYGANPPSHYGHAQRRILTDVERSKMLPFKWVIWTAHQRAVEDKLSKQIIVGPEVAGDALTKNLQRVFGNTLHFEAVAAKSKRKDPHTGKEVDELDLEYRINTRDHFSPEGAVVFKFKAVTRGVSADDMPPYLTGGPGEAIREFYMRLKELRMKRMQETKTAFEAAKGKVA